MFDANQETVKYIAKVHAAARWPAVHAHQTVHPGHPFFFSKKEKKKKHFFPFTLS
jgi:hypothetical protein